MTDKSLVERQDEALRKAMRALHIHDGGDEALAFYHGWKAGRADQQTETERLKEKLRSIAQQAKANAYGSDHVICYECASIAEKATDVDS